jgi:hypothetical protein
MVELDDRMDDKGYLRFCTREQTMRLMGNAISEEVLYLAKEFNIPVDDIHVPQNNKGMMGRLAQVKWIRYILQGIVNRLYNWLHQ